MTASVYGARKALNLHLKPCPSAQSPALERRPFSTSQILQGVETALHQAAAVAQSEDAWEEQHRALITYGKENICVGKVMKLILKSSSCMH